MRLRWAGLLVISCFVATTLAWTAEDHEIFDLVSALEAAEGGKVDFYSYMNVTPTATSADIAKAYRRRSLEMHPDRGGDPDRFARLGVISGILRDAEKRKRYHHFYENGVPRWRGTGYYYSRYRPGLGSVIMFLSLLSVLVQYAVQHLARFAEVQRIQRFQDKAREAAWGPTKQAPSANSAKKRVKVGLSENASQAVSMVVEANGNVSILDEDGKSHPIDASVARQASLANTWLPKLAKSLYRKIARKPASIHAVPSSRDLGDIDGQPSPLDGVSESEMSRPGTPASEVAMAAEDDAPQALNRKARRQHAKDSAKESKKRR